MIWDIFQSERSDVTFHSYRELAARSHSFEELGVADGEPWQPTITSAGKPTRVDGQRVIASYFRVLGVAPALGRAFREGDDRFKGPPVAILSDSLWRHRFNGDRSIIGRPILLDGNKATLTLGNGVITCTWPDGCGAELLRTRYGGNWMRSRSRGSPSSPDRFRRRWIAD